MNLKPVPNPAPYIACILAAGEAQDRMRASEPRAPLNPRPHPEPAKRRRSLTRGYGLTEAELPEYRRILSWYGLTALEAANILIRSRRPAPNPEGDAA